MATSAAPESGSKLSAELRRLRHKVGERVVTLGELNDTLGLRAHLVLTVLLALPFITPIPLPFVSTPFGLAIAGITLRVATGRPPRLSDKLRARPLPPGFVGKLLAVAAGLLGFLERRMRPRLAELVEPPALRRLHAITMTIAAGVLLLPLFVPLSNAFPALCILLIAAGLLERDGLAVIAGYLALALGAAYLVFLGGAVAELIERIRQSL